MSGPDGELAEVEQEIRDRLAECPRGVNGQPKLLMYHLVEILMEEYDRRGVVVEASRDWAAARLFDAHVTGKSVIPTAQRLLAALAELDAR